MNTARTTIDPSEVAQFSARAREWWDTSGKFATLHKFNPVRLAYIRDHAVRHFGLQGSAATPLEGITVLDIGCGGGLLAEPLTRLGASVTGIDPSERNVATAAVHAEEQGLDIDYRVAAAEDLADDGESFDVVLNMEVVEHVADLGLFMAKACALVRPGGLTVVATINRTLKAFALAIVGAEYVLQWLPRGTHSWSKFVTPDELESLLNENGLTVADRTGVVYRPLADEWVAAPDTDVNFMVLGTRPSDQRIPAS